MNLNECTSKHNQSNERTEQLQIMVLCKKQNLIWPGGSVAVYVLESAMCLLRN